MQSSAIVLQLCGAVMLVPASLEHRVGVPGVIPTPSPTDLHSARGAPLQRAKPLTLSTRTLNSSYLHLLMLLLQGNHRGGLIVLISLIMSALNCFTF